MYTMEELELMKPRMVIDYWTSNQEGFIAGTFDSVPENTYRANISTIYPVVGADGDFRLSRVSYNLFVGKVVNIESSLDNSSIVAIVYKEQLKKLYEAGVKNAVLTKPLGEFDLVFPTKEGMEAAIEKIGQTFNSVDFNIQNSETLKLSK